jgi:CubicO group peptidase (beta-lactamase class C family)
VSDGIDRYVPELRLTEYRGVTVQQAMNMRSGVQFDENGRDMQTYVDRVIQHNAERCWQLAARMPRVAIAGERFNYSTPEACVLGELVQRATGKSLANYMSDALWQPMRAEHQASWVLDGQPGVGSAIAGGGLSTTLRDLGRFGLLVANRGFVGGSAVVPSLWLDRIIAKDESKQVVDPRSR